MHESVRINHCAGMYFSQLAFNHAGVEVMDLTGVSCGCFSADCSSAGGIPPANSASEMIALHPPEKKR